MIGDTSPCMGQEVVAGGCGRRLWQCMAASHLLHEVNLPVLFLGEPHTLDDAALSGEEEAKSVGA